MHSPSERKIILDLVRLAVERFVDAGETIDPPHDPFFEIPSGAFVTLTIEGDLRGCIGFTEPKFSLGQTLVRCAILAAVKDPRFPPLQKEEMERVRVEVSVISEFREIQNVGEIEVGTHGLYLTSPTNRGLLLPQVATEHQWDRETFLNRTCNKAGLPSDAWKSPGVKIEIFTAEVFSEVS